MTTFSNLHISIKGENNAFTDGKSDLQEANSTNTDDLIRV